ncbi:hypothetical protein ACIP98_12395 [Streptomyces sp. NPDC088354]|uniref:hypothetical protein n=1 Tax=unclassified Streptomyces TaxID=2593676 RepID=UPI0029B3641C|nr:hypothetical protein [Streptomyces sp. MI02-7b]MDX3072893.1 hypothetical protein [Streptomyces sp. MI02-7b]
MLATVASKDRPRSAVYGDRWLVGFRFSTPQGAEGCHYYVVGEAADARDAVDIAATRATGAYECAARANAAIDGVEVHRLRWNPLGWAYLDSPASRV